MRHDSALPRWNSATEDLGRGHFRAGVSVGVALLGGASLLFLPTSMRAHPELLLLALGLGLLLGLSTLIKFFNPMWDRFGGLIGMAIITLLAAATGGADSPYTSLYLISLLYDAILQHRRRLIGESLFLVLNVAVLVRTTDGVTSGHIFSGAIRMSVLILMVAVVHALVSQLRNVATRLESSEQQYRSLVEYNPDSVHTFDLDGRFTSANPAAAAISGYTTDELREMRDIPLQALLAPDAVEETMQWYRATARGRPQHFETTILNRFGDRIEMQVATVPIVVDGRVVGVYSVCKDITDRKRAERLLRERAAQQSAVGRLGQSALRTEDLSTLLDEAARLVSETLNAPLSAVYELHGAGQALLVAGVGWEDGCVGSELVPVALPFDTGQAMEADGPFAVADYVLADEGQPVPLVERHLAGSGLSVALRSGDAVFGVLAIYDREPRVYTEDERSFFHTIANVAASAIGRRRAEQQLFQAQKLQAVGQLAGGIAHDFNNLLTAMLGYCELLQPQVASNPTAAQHLDEALKAGARARALVDQILTFSRGRVSKPEQRDVNTTVRDMEGLLRQLLPDRVVLRLDLTDALGLVRVDPSQLEQVVLNLVLNGRDAMPEGGVLRVHTSDTDLDEADAHALGVPAGPYVALMVEDTGEGMDQATAARVFEPFFTTKVPGKGTGLGLATVYGIVTGAGGQVRIDSQVGHGSRFTVFLPRVAQSSERAQAAPALPSHGEPVLLAGPLATIMVVEDQAAVRSLVCEILAERGYRVLQAANGVEARDLLAVHPGPVDLLITDVVMPQIQGPELAAMLRIDRPDLRVLYMSGYSAQPELLGPDDPSAEFLPKPFGVSELVERIEAMLSRGVSATRV